MMAMMMAMMTGRQPPPVTRHPVAPSPRLEEEEEESDFDELTLDDIPVPKARAPKRAPLPVAAGVGVTTRYHKKKRGFGNISSTVEVSDLI